MASASRKRTRRQRKLELYSKFLIPIPVAFMIPAVVGILRENAADPDPKLIMGLPFILVALLIPAGFLQLIIGLPTIATLRGKSLLAHMLTGLALAIVMIVSQGFADIASGVANSIGSPAPDRFSTNSRPEELSQSRSDFEFSTKDPILEEQATMEEIFTQILAIGLPMMFSYFLVWNIFTSLPDRHHRELTEERPDPNQRPIRTLRGEERKRTGKLVTRRKKRNVRRSL